jgi:hypothetical protein
MDEISNPKKQISNKLQKPKRKNQNATFGVFENLDLVLVWDLGFRICDFQKVFYG